jgi:hypothetical protein
MGAAKVHFQVDMARLITWLRLRSLAGPSQVFVCFAHSATSGRWRQWPSPGLLKSKVGAPSGDRLGLTHYPAPPPPAPARARRRRVPCSVLTCSLSAALALAPALVALALARPLLPCTCTHQPVPHSACTRTHALHVTRARAPFSPSSLEVAPPRCVTSRPAERRSPFLFQSAYPRLSGCSCSTFGLQGGHRCCAPHRSELCLTR